MILSRQLLKNVDPDEIKRNVILNNELNSLLLIVPTKRRIRDIEKDFIKSSPNKTAGKLNIHTIETVSAEILEGINNKFRLTDDAVSMVLLNQCYTELKGSLEYFPNDELPGGTLNRLKNVISEYKRTKITPELLEKEIETRELTLGEQLKIKDIVRLYRSYNAKTTLHGLKEIGDVYDDLNALAPEAFRKSFRMAYPSVNVIIIEGYDNFSLSEIDLIDRLGSIPGCSTFINFDYSGQNPSVFKHLESIYSSFLALKWFNIPSQTEKGAGFKEILAANLGLNKPTDGKYRAKDSSIFKIEAASRVEEIQTIGREIKELIKPSRTGESPVKPNDICVVFNKIDRYSSLIRDVFTSYNIPYNLTDRKVLANSLPVLAILNFLQIRENDFFYKDIMRAFSSGFIYVKDVNYPVLMEVARELKIVSGFMNWISRIDEMLALLDSDNQEDIWFLNSTKDKDLLLKARDYICRIHDELRPFEKPMSPSRFKEELAKLFERFNFKGIITGRIGRNKITGDDPDKSKHYFRLEENTRGYQKFIETLDDLLKLIESSGRDREYDLSFYLSQMRTAFKRTRFNVLEKYNYGVLITTPDEIRGLKFKHLFTGGLIDGDWPTPYSPEIFFTETFSRKDEEHQTEERYRFYQTLSSWTDRLYLSYPKHEDTREFEKSIFLKEFENIAEPEVLSSTIHSETVYSFQELLQSVGKNADTDIRGLINGMTQEDIRDAIAVDTLRTMNLYANTPFTGAINGTDEDNALLENISGKRKLLLDDSSKENLLKLRENVFSASQLETYAKCPYKYFSEKVLKLNVVEEPSEEVESNEMGTMLHKIFCRFYEEVKTENISVTQDNKERLMNKLLAIADDLIKNRLNSPLSFYEREKITGIAGNPQDSILYRFLTIEIESRDDGFVPMFFEEAFGYKDEMYHINGVKLRGQIDRIDINRSEKLFKVIDYKLGGKAPGKPQLEKGTALQLPIYLNAAREVIKKKLNEDYKPHSAIIYSLKYEADKFKKDVIIEDRPRKLSPIDAITISAEKIPEYMDSISIGAFGLNGEQRDKETCKYCNFSNTCRLEGDK